MRRKGEKKVPKTWQPWGPAHPVARCIREGDSWLDAWTGQACRPWSLVMRKTGITRERLGELHQSETPTMAEVEALAGVWCAAVADVVASLQIHPDKSIDGTANGREPRLMCNLYKLKVSRAEIATLFRAADHWQADMAKDYVAPGKDGPVVIERDGERITGLMAWGVPNAGKPVTNVRNLESPFWRNMLERPAHRCLVPVTEFEEWSATPDPATGKKRPHWFSIPSRPVFAFAGIWRKVEGQPRFAFLTTEPNTLVGAIHPKAMPVILGEADYGAWLTESWPGARRLVDAYPSQLMAVM